MKNADIVRRVAAATLVIAEFDQQTMESGESIDTSAMVVFPTQFSVMYKNGDWRKRQFIPRDELHWRGKMRVSSKGDILFQFEPSTAIKMRYDDIKMVEVPHSLLHMLNANFAANIENSLGASIEELIKQFEPLVSDVQLRQGKEISSTNDEDRIKVDMTDQAEGWGEWV